MSRGVEVAGFDTVRSMVARNPWSGFRSPFRANKLGALAFGTPHWGDASLVCRGRRVSESQPPANKNGSHP